MMNTRRFLLFGFLLRRLARAGFQRTNWLPNQWLTWDGSRFSELLIRIGQEVWSLLRVHTRARDMRGFFLTLRQRVRDFRRSGPLLARAVDDDHIFEVFGRPVRFEQPSQITDRFSEISACIGEFGILDEHDHFFHTFREGRIKCSSRNPEALARDYGLDAITADLVISAWVTDWAFLVIHLPKGPLVFGRHAYIADDPEDEISRANWHFAESMIFDSESDRDMDYVPPNRLHYFGELGYTNHESILEDISVETAVIASGSERWIRAELIDDYVSALADYPILCDETYSELCHEIETESLTSWVFDELGHLIGKECEDLEETWEMLEDDTKAELWQIACEQSAFPYEVVNGGLNVDYPSILPHIIDALDGLPVPLDDSELSAGANGINQSL